jgi:ABC-type branched-subunit amino acid transport system permease subunit
VRRSGAGDQIATVGLRGDYLAMATLGIAEILRLVAHNEAWLTGTSRACRGLRSLPLEWAPAAFLGVVLVAIAAVYWAAGALRAALGPRAARDPDNEHAAAAAGGTSAPSACSPSWSARW